MSHKNKTVLVAMSGGVDSSVVAAMLQEQGTHVIGVSLRLYDAGGDRKSGFEATPDFGSCCSLDDLATARRMAQELGIAHYTVDMVQEFQESVYQYFIDEYARGRTPSPCVKCNDIIKFDKLYDVMNEVGASHIATGHYARIEDGRQLWRGLDDSKDQSYFLARTPEHKLKKLMFPLGKLHKSKVRELAAGYGLKAANKPDSQDLCFVPDGKTAEFIGARIDKVSGPLITPDGKVAGTHSGIHNFTPGQRKGHGISWTEPLFVHNIDPQGSVKLAVRSSMYSDRFTVTDPVWVAEPPVEGAQLNAQIRYRSTAKAAVVTAIDEKSFEIQMNEPVFAPAPGQLVALYQGDRVLGGGFLEEVL